MFSLFDVKIILKTALSWGKKIFLVIFVYAVVVSLFTYFIGKDKAALNTQKPTAFQTNRLKLYNLVNNPELQKTKQGKQTLAIYRSIICGLIGETCTNNPADAHKYLSKSLTGQITGLFMLPLTNPPASGVYWAKSGLEEAGFVPKSYAAEGIGFSSLRPIMNLWKVFRDLSYMLLVLVLIAIGFMIMFRMKLNPQTIIGVENALPKIVVSMLLITFSFAIAGFMIDLMYVSIAVVIALVSNNGAFYDIGKMQNNYLNGNASSLWDSLFFGSTQRFSDKMINVGVEQGPLDIGFKVGTAWNYVVGGVGGFTLLNNIGHALYLTVTAALPPFISGTINYILNGTVGFLIINHFFPILFEFLGKAGNGIGIGPINTGNLPQLFGYLLVFSLTGILGQFFTSLLIPVILGILVFFTLLLLFFRIFFLLFKAYLQIIFMIIIAPFLLLFEAIPGKGTFSVWFKHLAADVFTFPIVVAILTISYVLSQQISAGQTFWQPPFLNALGPDTLSIFISMGILMMTPDLVKFARQSLFGIKDLPINFGLGTFFGGAAVAGGGAVSLLGQVSSINLGITALSPVQGGTLADKLRGMLGKTPAASTENIPPVAGGGPRPKQ